MISTRKKVVVAMSGGVDSSVAALLLHEQGHEVIGISLKVWDYGEEVNERSKTCCSYRDIEDARRVCEKIGIPFYAFNFKTEFKEKVILPFVDSYFRGQTPNPCILCNRNIKFDGLLNEARQLGADFLATGHHARVLRDDAGNCSLVKGVDLSKDQSYVLYAIPSDDLKKILLPVGDFTKAEIRALAEKHGLATAQKAESQDICFVPSRDHAAFIATQFPDRKPPPGKFVDEDGKELGDHQGIHAYTVGQRRGLGIGFGERMYVMRIDAANNRIVLGTRDDARFTGLKAEAVNWLKRPETDAFECLVKVRYQKDEIPCAVTIKGSEADVTFFSTGPAVSPGQAAVFYLGDEVIGGGTISESVMEGFAA